MSKELDSRAELQEIFDPEATVEIKESRQHLLAAYEQKTGTAINPDIKKELVESGVYSYDNAAQRHREIDLTSPFPAAIEAELQELSRNFLQGKGQDADVSDIATTHAVNLQRIEANKERQ